MGDEQASNCEIRGYRKTYQVEPDAVARKFKRLPKEISLARAREKSAEAIVVKRLVERSEERRAKEPRDNHPNPDRAKAQRLIKTPRRGNSGIDRGERPREAVVEPRTSRGEPRRVEARGRGTKETKVE